MTIKEAYELIKWEDTNKEITPTLIRREFNKNSLKIQRNNILKVFYQGKTSPDEPRNKYTEITEDINHAYEFLRRYLDDKRYTKTTDNYVLATAHILEEHDQKIANLKVEYNEKFEKALLIRKYFIYNEILKITNEYETKMNFHKNALTLFNLRNEYPKKIAELKAKLTVTEDKYNFLMLVLSHSQDLNETYLKNALDDLLADNEQKVYLDKDYKKAQEWYHNEYQKFLKTINNKASAINNIIPTLARRLNESYKLYKCISVTEIYKTIVNTKEKLENEIDPFNKNQIVNKYQNKLLNIKQKITECKKKYKIYKVIVTGISNDWLDERLALAIDKEIESVITKKYLNILDNPTLFAEKYAEYNAIINNRPQLKEAEIIVPETKKEVPATQDSTIIDEINIKYQSLVEISKLLGREAFKLPKLSNISAEEALHINDKVKKELREAQIEMIKIYWEDMIADYISKINYFEEEKAKDMEYYDNLYKDFYQNKDSADMVSYYYQEFKLKYSSFKLDPNRKGRTARAFLTALKLRDEIINLKNLCLSNNLKLDENSIDKYLKDKNTDISILYHLYNQLNKFYEENKKSVRSNH